MHLSTVEVKNFNGKNYSLTPDKINTLIDKNGAGKTSLLRAILWGLTGEKVEADDTDVLIEFDPSFVIERSRHGGKNSCKLNGNKVTEKALNAAIEDKIDIKLDNVKLSSSEAVLEATKPEELLKALIGFVTEELTVDKVISHLTSAGPEVIKKVKEVFPPSPKTFALDELEEVYKGLYEERKLKSAAIKQQTAVFKSLEEKTTRPARTLEKISAELLSLEVAEKNAADAAKRLRDFEKADAAEKARIAEMKKIEEEVKNLTFKGHSSTEQKLQEERRQEAEQKRLKLTAQKTTVENNVKIFERTLENLGKPVCPISDKLICTTDKTGIKAELEKSVSDNKKLITDIEKEIAGCNANLETYKLWKKQLDEDAERYKTKLQLLERHKVLKEHPTVIPEKPVVADASTIIKKKSDLQNEKTNCENFLKMEELRKKLKSQEDEMRVLDYLVSALKDKGEVKEAIIRGYLVVFEDTMNERAKAFAPGYKVSLSVNGGLKSALKTPYNKEAFDSSTLSGGEKLILRFLMLDMLNQLTGTNLLFIDNVESLDEDALNNLYGLINSEEFKSLYDHVFIAGVNHPDVLEKFKI